MASDSRSRFAFVKNIATGDGDTDLVAAPAAGKTLVLQHLIVTITTAAAQTFNIEDKASSNPQIYFKAVASQAVGNYTVNLGETGVPASAAATALEYDCSAAGVSATISGFGYITD